MKGRRIPSEAAAEATGGILAAVTEPGDYCGPIRGYTADKPAMFFLLPIARDEGVDSCARSLHHIQFPPHSFTEEPDGSLSVQGSILSYNSDGSPGWHGYLEKGIWRAV